MSTDKQYAQDSLIFDVTEDLLLAMEDRGVTKKRLAEKLGKSKASVSQMLSGERNMTLRTLASICFELGVEVEVKVGNGVSVKHQPLCGEYSWAPDAQLLASSTVHSKVRSFQILNGGKKSYSVDAA